MLNSHADSKPRCWAIIPAAGVGTRMGAHIPKQYLPLLGRPLLVHTVEKLLAVDELAAIVVAHSRNDMYWSALSCARDSRIREAEGGVTRAETVFNALTVVLLEAAENDWVLVHDAARPCITTDAIKTLIANVANSDVGGLSAAPITETIKKTDGNNKVVATVNRDNLWVAQTPQIFRVGLLRDCLLAALTAGDAITDEASAIELAGFTPEVFQGRSDNIKITHPGDLALAELILQQQLQEERK